MADYGRKIEGFGGHTVNHEREIPEVYATRGSTRKVNPVERERDDLLPIEGWLADMRVISYEPAGLYSDPVCLYDRWGRIVHQWPDGYIPTLDEVKECVIVIRGGD